MPQTIAVRTSATAYDVHIGPGLLAEVAPRTDAQIGGALTSGRARAFIITSPEIWRMHGPALASGFTTPPTVLHVEPGEQHKRLATIERLASELHAAYADRDSILFAFGGGVLGDMTGFLAAIYMRGIRYIGVPTTLLAQIDSSLGGKTGVNITSGKNLLGAFHHPLAVFADTSTLGTLPPRELRAGLQEAIKAGIIRDKTLFDLLETEAATTLNGCHPERSEGSAFLTDPHVSAILPEIIARSVQVKATVVANDERETGERMLLNLGHTFGHAIEAATGYTQLLHGEAVAWGMLAAVRIALHRSLLTPEEAARIAAVITTYGPLHFFNASAEDLVTRTVGDKKNRGGIRSFILPVGIGDARIVHGITEAELLDAATYLSTAAANQGFTALSEVRA